VIATTDGEIDDRCSMIRFLLYANEWDIKGLIYSSSKHHWKGDAEHPGKNWHNTTWIEEQIDKYAQVYPNLKKHDLDYPAPDYLKSQVFVGNIALEGDMREETPGSNRIAEVLLDDDPSPVWLQAWGGGNTIARALKSIQEKHPDRMADVSRKAIVYLIAEQDNTHETYIMKQWPDIQIILSYAFRAIAYRWYNFMDDEQQRYFDGKWMKENILEGHGPLCAMYEAHSDGRFRSEGDSPSYMHEINVGLRSMEHPTYGGWGGRFKRVGPMWRDAEDDGDREKAILRWSIPFQNDWAARADWCIKKYDEANHPPVVKLAHELDLRAKTSQTVQLSAKGTTDLDGDAITYKWWQYKEPGSYRGTVNIDNADQQEISLIVPDDASNGETIHIICEVTDNGTPPLTRYQRVIVEVSP
jgi:hypothetical protein